MKPIVCKKHIPADLDLRPARISPYVGFPEASSLVYAGKFAWSGPPQYIALTRQHVALFKGIRTSSHLKSRSARGRKRALLAAIL